MTPLIPPEFYQDPNWYSNTDTTHHMTSDVHFKRNCTPYTGSNQVSLGNSGTILIANFGDIPLYLWVHNHFNYEMLTIFLTCARTCCQSLRLQKTTK